MYVLDTDVMTALERDSDIARTIRSKLSQIPLDDLATTIATYEEQTRGWFAVMARARTQRDQIDAYSRLKTHIRIYCRIPILDYDQQAADKFERLRTLRLKIGTMDMKIASIALANDAILITRNLADFTRVPNLRVEDWTV